MSLRILFVLLSLSACAAKAPDIESCILIVKKDKLDASYGECTLKDGAKKKKPIEEFNKSVVIPANDFFSYLRYCKQK